MRLLLFEGAKAVVVPARASSKATSFIALVFGVNGCGGVCLFVCSLQMKGFEISKLSFGCSCGRLLTFDEIVFTVSTVVS